MDFILLLLVIVGGPIIVIGATQLLIYKLFGSRWLRIVSALIVLACLALLVSEYSAPPVYGNKSGLIGLGVAGIGLLLIENLAILCAPLMGRLAAWEKNKRALQLAEVSEKMEIQK